MDFIKCLLDSEGYINIFVVVHWLTKQVIFSSIHSLIDTEELVNLFVKNIFLKHKVPSYVTSDRKTKFMLKFLKSLATALNMKLHFSAGYHLEANEQTE